MRLLSAIAMTAVLAACASKAPEEKKPVSAAASPVASTAAPAAPPAPKPELGDFGIDLTAADHSVKPGDDFFAYANGTWDKNFTIPADKSSFGPFDKLDELSKVRVRGIIEKAAGSHAANGTPDQQIGDFYAAYMDQTAIEANGLAPAQPALERIAAAKSRADIARLFGTVGFASLFDVQFPADLKDPDRYSVLLTQSGLGLPDRDYYLKDDPQLQALR